MKTLATLHAEQKMELEEFCYGENGMLIDNPQERLPEFQKEFTKYLLSQIDLMIEIVESSRESNACYEPHYVKDTDCTCGKFKTAKETDAYNTALSDLSTLLSAQKKLIEEQIPCRE